MRLSSRLALGLAAVSLALATPALSQNLTIDLGSSIDAAGSATAGAAGDDANLTTGSTTNVQSDASAEVDADDVTATASTAFSFDVNGDGNLDAEELGELTAALDAAGNADFEVDANGDGNLDQDELAEITAALSGSASGSASGSFDSDGDGIISADEQEAAASLIAAGNFDCAGSGLESVIALTASYDEAALMAATNARVVVVDDCDAGDVRAALAAEGATSVRSDIQANDVAVSALQSRGYQMDDVLRATVSGETVTIYVVSEQSVG